jgi:hypothetical protein
MQAEKDSVDMIATGIHGCSAAYYLLHRTQACSSTPGARPEAKPRGLLINHVDMTAKASKLRALRDALVGCSPRLQAKVAKGKILGASCKPLGAKAVADLRDSVVPCTAPPRNQLSVAVHVSACGMRGVHVLVYLLLVSVGACSPWGPVVWVCVVCVWVCVVCVFSIRPSSRVRCLVISMVPRWLNG